MTNLVDSLQAPPRADRAAASEPGHPEVLRGVRPATPSSPLTSDLHPPTSKRSGLTLIEMLVALAVTLVMMAAVVNLFANMSESIRNRRAAIETGSQLRQVRNRLAMDLSGATSRGSTWQDPAENQGYIEIVEGQWSDKNPSHLIDGDTTNNEIDYTTSLVPGSQAVDTLNGDVTDGLALGDWDDVLALTTQNESVPFTGKVPYYNNVSGTLESRFEESHQAEVIWFAEQNGVGGGNGEPGMRRIYRRALLLRPDLQIPPLTQLSLSGTTDLEKLADFRAKYDLSVRLEDGRLIGNTLADLNKREHRYFHYFDPTAANNGFPHAISNLPNGTADWLVLNNALAFDVRVFDPGAPLFNAGSAVLEPVDLAYAAAPVPDGFGAYVDLGWGANPGSTNVVWPVGASFADPFLNLPPNMPAPQFHVRHQAGWHPRNLTNFTGSPAVYDTWSYHYENDGLDQDGNAIFDQGANGLDDDNVNGVDDRGERETAPPYDVPLRGVKVILRVYEPDARQIRESSVTHSFKQ